MPIQTVRNLLVAAATASPATALAAVGQRVSPQFRDQSEPLPCITLTLVSTEPQNHLYGAATLDSSMVQVDVWAATYAEVRALADASRDALEAAGLKLQQEREEYDEIVQERRVSQDWFVWINY